MKKKKLLLPLAVMTLSCGLCAGILTGCGGEHKHDYTKWAHDETGHWQICVEDNETTEKEPHAWGGDGKCECGAEQPAYGTASGTVRLIKLGENVTDYAGVTIDAGEDDGIEIDYDTQTGVFTITNARVGKVYKCSISKAGYLTTYVNVQAVKDQNVALGDCVLQYDAFTHGSHTGSDWSGNYGTPSKIDKSHVNDAENAYFTIGEGTGDFYVYSKESYGSVTASVTYKEGVTSGADDAEIGNQGLRLVFEDGKAVMIRIEKMSDGKFKAQWIGGNDWEETPIYNNWDFGSGEEYFNPFSAEAETQYKETGIGLKLVRNGGIVRAYVNGQFMGEQILPEEYATQKCRVALAAAHVNGGVNIPFSISQTLPEVEFDSSLTLETGTLPQGVEVSLDKTEGYQRGDFVTLSVKLPEEGDFMIGTISLGEVSLLDRLAEGKVSFLLTEKTNVLTVAVKQIAYANLTDVAVTGKKYDVTGNSLEGKTVTLKGQGGLMDVEITVTDGKFSKDRVAQGTYTAECEGYKPATVVIGENGIPNGITLEYDGFTFLENYDTNVHDFSNANAENSAVQLTGNGTLNILTKDSFMDVAVSLRIKYNNSSNGMRTQGIVLKFEDGKHVIVRYHNGDQPNGNIQYANSAWEGCPASNTLFGADAGLNQWGEAPIHTLLDDETTAIKADGLYLTCVLKDGKLYTFFNEKWVATYNLPNGYDGKNVQIGFFTWNMVENAVAEFKITETLPNLSVSVTNGTAANGTVALSSTTPKYGDAVTVTLTPAEGYILKSFTIDGKDVTGSVTFDESMVGTYTFTATADVEIAAEFEVAIYGNIDTAISGLKGTEEIVLNGTKVTLTNAKAKYEYTIADGKLTLHNVLTGTYTLTADEYVSQTVTVTESGIAEAIVLVYNIFTSAPDTADLTALGDGKITATGNGNVDLETKEKYTNVTVEAHFDVPDYNSRRYSVALVFADGKNFRVDFAVQDNGNNILQQTNWNSMMFNWEWVAFPEGYFAAGTNSYTEEEIKSEFIAKGLTYKLVRDGATVKLYINGVLMKTYTLPDGYKDQEAQLKFIFDSNGTDGTKGFAFNITVPEADGGAA